MAQQTLKYCPKCCEQQFFEWQIEKEDTELNNLEFWLQCVECGYTTTEEKLQ